MRLTTTLSFAGMLAMAGTAGAQPLPFVTSTHLLRPPETERVLSVPAADLPAANAREVRLGDITLQKQTDRAVRMQWTMGAQSASLPAPASDLRGQALVTLHVRFVVTLGP
jgi:hypothetical protein